MKNFFKNRTWDDYLAMVVIGIIILGLILFFVGFYAGFEVHNEDFDLGVGFDYPKQSVAKILKSHDSYVSGIIGISASADYNLFTLAGALTPASGAIYGLVVTSILGFSLIMLGFAIVIIVIVVGFIYDMVLKSKQKKQ